VEGTPYTAGGSLRPVKLNACGCTMSALAARSSAEVGKCKVCYKALKSDKGFSEDDKVRCSLLVCTRMHTYTCVMGLLDIVLLR
jgi:hypothetical protein